METLIERATGRAWLGGKKFSKGFKTTDYLRHGGLGDIDFSALAHVPARKVLSYKRSYLGWRGAITRTIMRRKLDAGPVDSLSRLKRAAEQRYRK